MIIDEIVRLYFEHGNLDRALAEIKKIIAPRQAESLRRAFKKGE
jgi:hypothetical protein